MRSLIRWAVAAAMSLAVTAPAQAAWYEAKSKHFIVYADERPNELRDYAYNLERFDQAVRYVRRMDDPDLTDSGRVRIFVLRSTGAVAHLAGNSMVRGFYHTRASGSVAFVPRSAGDGNWWDLNTQEIFFHEYAHHLQLQDSSIAMPEWVREGFAEFFATARTEKDGSVIIGNPPQYRAYGLFNGTGLSLEQMLGGTYRRLDGPAEDLLYGEGWLLTHYLTFNEARKGQLSRYIDGIQTGKSALDSARAAFGDLKVLDRELEHYKEGKLIGIRVLGSKLVVGPIAIRQLGSGEAAMMDVHIRSTRGVDSKTAPGVAADANKVAAGYPNDPFVQACLAEADYDARDYAGADAAADRALAADPNNIHALIYKGRAQMALAKANPKGANWEAVRQWFIKANKLDTENAEPLALFFRSFAESKQPPTKNAVDALLYAVVLAPQDEELRINAVRQLLTDNRLADAKEMLTPMAYQPHASAEWRETSAKMLDSIAAGDAKSALALVDQAMTHAEDQAKKP